METPASTRQEITEFSELDRKLVTFSDNRGIGSDIKGVTVPAVTFHGSRELHSVQRTRDVGGFSDF